MLVADGIHWFRVKIPVGPKHGNIYLLEDSDGPVLIDAGFPSDEVWTELTAQMSRVGYAPRDIVTVIGTHEHQDHAGASARLRELFGTTVWLHESAFLNTNRFANNRDYWSPTGRQWWSRIGLPADELALMEQDFNNTPPIEPFEYDRGLTEGEILTIGGHDYQVIWTPGHSEAHICLYDMRRRILFSGDHVLPKITPHIARDHATRPNPLQDYKRSLSKVARLPLDLVLPGHYRPFKNGTGRIAEIQQHHEERMRAVEQTLGHKGRTAWEITWDVFGDNPSLVDRQLACSETIANLYYLAACGRVDIEEGDPVTLYSRSGKLTGYIGSRCPPVEAPART
ncbi:MAG: MBL fold metallo-hydrolase [Chloroflexota bacterium]|nr:MAG: MBL fold metallo-hydrolase [Chloroflexota bacterium]